MYGLFGKRRYRYSRPMERLGDYFETGDEEDWNFRMVEQIVPMFCSATMKRLGILYSESFLHCSRE